MLDSVEVDDVDLYYQDVGSGDPIVFLHGFSGNHFYWWRQLGHFAPEYRCIAPDQRRFGLSIDAGDGPGVGAFVTDLEAMLDALGIDSATVVGHSMGGWPAASFATQHPDRVDGLVLSATPGGLLTPEEHSRLQSAADPQPEPDAVSIELSLLSDLIADLNRDAPAEWTDVRPVLDEFPADPGPINDAGVPVFVVAGEADGFTPRPVLDALTDRFDTAESAVVQDAGHTANFQRPAAFNRVLGAFLDEHVQG